MKMRRLPTPPADLDQMQEVELGLTFETVLQKHLSAFKKKRIRVESHLGKLPYVRANKWLLAQALNHLTKNAIDALDHKGRISVSGELKENQVHLTFADNGTGIPPRVLRVLFKRRVPGHKGQGSGFGLLLSKMYVNACNGDLTLDHSDETGTTFVINLPIAMGSQMKIPRGS